MTHKYQKVLIIQLLSNPSQIHRPHHLRISTISIPSGELLVVEQNLRDRTCGDNENNITDFPVWEDVENHAFLRIF